MSKIAFLGLGNMGCPMAVNLLKSGHDVIGFDLSKEAMTAFAQNGGNSAETALHACKDADVVVTMLPSGKHVADLLTEEFLGSLKPKTLIIESSTIEPTIAKSVALKAQAHDCLMVDAPVSGGTSGAKNGTLTFIVGGTDEAMEKAKPYLACMGKNIFHAGPSGAGQLTKICNNLLLSVLMVGTSEALNLGVASGLDPKVLSEIMLQSSGRNWALEVYNPYPGVMEGVPASRGYTNGFAVDLMVKDLGLALDVARTASINTPLGNNAFDLYKEWSSAGNGKQDFSSIICSLKKEDKE